MIRVFLIGVCSLRGIWQFICKRLPICAFSAAAYAPEQYRCYRSHMVRFVCSLHCYPCIISFRYRSFISAPRSRSTPANSPIPLCAMLLSFTSFRSRRWFCRYFAFPASLFLVVWRIALGPLLFLRICSFRLRQLVGAHFRTPPIAMRP